MARLIYSVIASLDGYSADETGRFGWATSDWAVSDGPFRTGRFGLELLDERCFTGGVVHPHYRSKS